MPPTPDPISSVPSQPAVPPSLLESAPHRPRVIAGLVAVALVVAAIFIFVQAPLSVERKAITIGIISIAQVKEANAGFKSKMAELGYDNVTYLEYETFPGPELLSFTTKAFDEMLEKDVDLIMANLEMQAKMAVDLTQERGRTDIPVVFLSRLHDPVEYGLAASLESSGNNSAGVATNLLEIVERHLDFLKQIRPEAKKLGVFGKGFQIPSVADGFYAELKRQAPRFGFEIVEYSTSVPPPQAEAEFNRIAATIQKGDIDALIHVAGHYYAVQEAGESQLAIRLGIPMATNYEDIPRGGHFTYSNGTFESGEQLAVIADKIIRGASPSEIPVEYAQKSMLSLHLDRAREAGIEFPESMLFLAENKFTNESFGTSTKDH